ncbi:RmlC-like cupin domain-containing protein [Nemania sp. FL0031]|nr:RmlC-like cupin domain-containing protein [Nemania sp. FL0031]
MEESGVFKAMKMPRRPITFLPAKAGEILTLGPIKCRIMEDGSRTDELPAGVMSLPSRVDNRIGAAEFTVPANTSGPPPHWHEMHDETFLVTKGMIRFHAPDGKHIDAKEGDYVVVPTRAPHTFSNPTAEEAIFFNTFTPAYYINYFKLMAEMAGGGSRPLTKDEFVEAMSRYATIPASEMSP